MNISDYGNYVNEKTLIVKFICRITGDAFFAATRNDQLTFVHVRKINAISLPEAM